MYPPIKAIAMKKLEEIDTKILKILLKDGRTNFTAIARNCKVSKDVIWTHYKELKKVGIIVGATIQYNFQKFGYNGFAMIMLSVESQNLTNVFSRISNISDVYAFRFYNSTYNIAAISTLKNLSELEHVKQVINKENKINEFKTQLWIDVRNIPENILADPESQNDDVGCQVNTQKNPARIDEIDVQIINALTINGRLAFRTIAQQIGTTTATVARRYEKLKENNFIKVSIQVNFLEMGYQNILEISLAIADQNEVNEMTNKLSKIPGVTYLVKISGNYDISVVALVKDCKNIVEISDQIIKIPNIKRMEATLRRLPAIWPGPRQFISTF
jgi:Lrp/AsnC family transcriptional regulator for asnA, asnC and gidA